MVLRKPLRVIHWVHNKPKDATQHYSEESSLHSFPLKQNQTKELMGVMFRWTLRIKTKNEVVLSYIGEQDFLFNGYYPISEEELWKIIDDSHSHYRKEFDSRKRPVGLTYSIAPKQRSDIDLWEILEELGK